ncbi:hypothetical protein GCM10027515_13450 [Schumannella luteola]|uniref:Uncharacterized protein n=1 Tax=Schumannella luteola TaxID=472059 RepID=A0A852Y7D4_9MICO|nr:hypothetical protein [Schumannella luteola]NYG97792.1 hypothetical protein [Schumannella luteola]TPX02943.1 hypothetical protein FJ656_20000 [Schumannella luteola]
MSVDPRYAARFQRGFDPSEHGAGDAAGAPSAAPATPATSGATHAIGSPPAASPFARGSVTPGASPQSASPFSRDAATPRAAQPSSASPFSRDAAGPPPAAPASASPYSRTGSAAGGAVAPAPAPASSETAAPAAYPPESWSRQASVDDPQPRAAATFDAASSSSSTTTTTSAGPRASQPVRLGPNGERLAPSVAPDDDPAARYAEIADELTDDELRELGLVQRRRPNPWIILLAVVSLVALVAAVALSMSTYEMQADGYGTGFDSDRGAADQAWFFFLQQAGQMLAAPLYFLGILGTVVTTVLLLILRQRR